MKDAEHKQFLDNRDMLRLMEELHEATRRRMVLSGEWTEEESHSRIKSEVKEANKDAPEFLDYQKEYRDFTEIRDFLWMIQGSGDHKAFEKEYYFDEGLGESLKDHVDGIKNNFPNLQVLVRRDREGYPIVKTLYKPQYKYDINKISNFDADKSMEKVKESLDDVLKTILGNNSVHELDKS